MTGLRCRQIEEDDIDAVTALLVRGFPARDQQFWSGALKQLSKHEPPAGLPKYGYLLATDDEVVGAVLLIFSTVRTGETTTTRCNLSSWYVAPRFRAYAPLLAAQALRHNNVTYTNNSPAPHTRPIIETQGFSCYCDGIFIALPALNGLFGGWATRIFTADQQPDADFDPFDRDVLSRHAAHGCISLWCVAGGRAYPFVFRLRLIRGRVPCAQLIYCRDLGEFVRFAGPLGRFLARRGGAIVLIDAHARIPGLFGWFRRGGLPKYFKGPQRPRLGDLAYSEQAVLGV